MSNLDKALDQFRKGRFGEASILLTRVIDNNEDPRLSDHHCNRGYCYFLLEAHDKAELDLKKAIELNEHNYLAHIWLSMVYLDKGKDELGQKHWQRAILVGGDKVQEIYNFVISNANSIRAQNAIAKVDGLVTVD